MTTICPYCHGACWTVTERFRCSVCRGTGEITQEHADRIKAGATMHLQRMERNETLIDAARRLGITPSRLSAIERGEEWTAREQAIILRK